MQIELHPIRLNEPRSADPDLLAICEGTKALYGRVGYAPPWIGYLAKVGDEVVGTCAFKSSPRRARVEIAYCTLPEHENRGMATEMVRKLIEIAKRADPSILIFAQTEPVYSASHRVLEKVGFKSVGPLQHPRDGEVCEWIFETQTTREKNEQFV